MSSKKVLVLCGPTGVGKTAISITLAQRFHGEIINADASQIHKELTIGTAKITKEEMQGVPHHLIDFLPPTAPFSIKDYQDQARKLIETINHPILVGGSGLYIKAALTDYDLSSEPRDIDEDPRSNEELHQVLRSLDPVAAEKIHPNNRRRVLRYIELATTRGTVKPKEATMLYDVLVICLLRPRDDLYQRINERVLAMMKAGWLEEVKSLIHQGINLDLVQEIGYRELGDYLNGKLTLEAAIDSIQKQTRHYAKRQITWFKHQMKATFIDLSSQTLEDVENITQEFYAKHE